VGEHTKSGVRATLQQLLQNEARCKAACTCQRLTIRELFFEPNPHTVETWQSEHRFFEKGIDRRVVFICESPSDRRDRAEGEHFEVAGQKGWICWNLTGQDRRFHRARVHHGFQHCLITNAVKCGLPKPSTPSNLTKEESENCAVHLVAELTAIQPVVVACMGGRAFDIAVKYSLPKLAFTPLPVLLNHYSHRGSSDVLDERWAEQFGIIRLALGSRGISPDEPLWMPFEP